jgi:hypothetical protein
MHCNRRLALWALALFSISIHADQTSYHFLGPVAMMYDLPTGSSPGWSSPTWVNIEVSASNVWNHGANFTDKRNGNVYYFFADYEEENAIVEFGRALTPNLAASLEVPYANHNGGFMDDAVDQFHELIGSDRFMRDVSPKFGNHMVVETNGVNMLTTEHAEGVGNLKGKLKYWLWHLNSPTAGACDCGLSVSVQAKFPMQPRDHGLTSGSNDYSGLIHFGVPFGQSSGAYATAAWTKLGPNDTFAGWPRNDVLQMYELSLNIGLTPKLALVLQGRAESPLFNKSDLNFTYTQSTPDQQLEERVASGWNDLVEWRGSEDIGLRWTYSKSTQINFLFVEDWAIGNQDQSGDGLYINDAPDFEFMTQIHFDF